jgi:aspartyl-tRNA(Asn)/glutamyl-tRNA(Gln) amidotransferase subunit A
MSQLVGKRIKELRNLLSKKEVSAREILDAHLTHIKNYNNEIDAFNCVTENLAREQAERVDKQIAQGEAVGRLAGIPIAIKDNMCVPGYPTTCSSKILENFTPFYTATAVQRLFDEGAVCVGKTNMDEFAMGSSTENSAFKKTKNPWNTNCVPGGSSGGSAASVAAGFSVVALGSDTGGSIRQPASFCGVAGMKPTYGLVSRFGLVAFASSLDQIGPFGRSVEDIAETLSVMAGHDPKDSTSLSSISQDSHSVKHMDFTAGLDGDTLAHVLKFKVGVIKELLGEGIEPEVRAAVSAAAEQFKKMGCAVEEVSIPHAKYALPVYYLIATAEASANLARFDGVRYGLRDKEAKDILSMYMQTRHDGFGAEVKRRIMLGTYALSSGYYDAYYKKAQQVRRLLKNDFDRTFAQYDLVLTPTSPSVAFAVGEKVDDPLTMYLSDIATIPANLAGLPGISIPCGFGVSGLPIGLQILGNTLSDAKLLKAAYAYQQSTDFTNGTETLRGKLHAK